MWTLIEGSEFRVQGLGFQNPVGTLPPIKLALNEHWGSQLWLAVKFN